MTVTRHHGTAPALKTFWDEAAAFREKDTDPHRTKPPSPPVNCSGSFRLGGAAPNRTGEERASERPGSVACRAASLLSPSPPGRLRAAPAPQPSPRENPAPSSFADGARPPTAPCAGSHPPRPLATRERRPQHGSLRPPPRTRPARPSQLPPSARPAPRLLEMVQGVDAAGGLPVPAAHPAAGAAEHAGGERLLWPAGL